MAHGHPPGARRRDRSPPLWARLLVLLLVVSLTAVYAYAACQQMQARHREGPRDRIEAVDAIRAYVQRLERALGSNDGRNTQELGH